MLQVFIDAQVLAERMERAAQRTAESIDRIPQEPQFTDRMLARLEDAVNEFDRTSGGVRWQARTLADRGPSSEESRVGADFMGIFEAAVGPFQTAKGFLAQAKLLDAGSPIGAGEHNRLRQQCRKMLERTPDAFVFLYGHGGVRVVSGLAVHDSTERRLDELGAKTVKEFFFDHFRCFIGDATLASPLQLPLARVVSRGRIAWMEMPRLLVIEALGVTT